MNTARRRTDRETSRLRASPPGTHPPAPLPFVSVVIVEVEYRDEITVGASAELAFALVADVYRSGMHFPSVDALTPVDNAGRWRWKMKEKGLGPVKLRATYDSVYVNDPALRTVTWEPAVTGGFGDMESSGTWEVLPEGKGARMKFDARTVAHIPGPRLLGKMIEAFAREELMRLKRQYVAAIAKTLNSGG